MLRTKTYTARLKKHARDNLDTFLLQQKFLYNKALNERINYYKETGKTLSNIDQRNAYTKFRQENTDTRYLIHMHKEQYTTGFTSRFRIILWTS